MSSKYAGLLPDLDNSQDVYETPDLADDVSTLPTVTPPTQSDIDASDLPPHSATRAFFNHSILDATQADFSDRISSKRRSYAISTRRARRRQQHSDVLGDITDDDEDVHDDEDEDEDGEFGDESVRRKLARLKREVEELRGQIARQEEKDGDNEAAEKRRGVEELVEALKTLDIDGADGAQKRLAAKVAESMGAAGEVEKPVPSEKTKAEEEQKPTTSTYTITYAPGYAQSHTLSQVADFDERLLMLERVLGLPQSALNDLDGDVPMHAIIPTLNDLSAKILSLANSSVPNIENAARRAKNLTAETEKLTEARKAAKAAALEGITDPLEQDETVSKINALYGLLPTVEKMTPLLPATLQRLRSLRTVHQDAARAAEALTELEKRQEEMNVELKKWEETLEKVEGVMKESTGTIEQNVVKVEGWVRALEEKLEQTERME